MGVQERHDIFVRAHAPSPRSEWRRKRPEKWPEFALVFDTESTIDPKQKLTFGCYRRCQFVGDRYQCIEEGLFYSDSLPPTSQRLVARYVNNPVNIPSTERLPPQIKLKLHTRTSLVRSLFWTAVQSGHLIVGFNLPFDLSRIAVQSTNADKGGWSLILSLRKSKKTGETEVDLDRPRLVVTSINSKMAFFQLSSNIHPDEWPNEPRFLDLRTVTWALRRESFNLNRACGAFGVAGKMKNHTATGEVTPKEIRYCREDVAATNRLLNAAKEEFDRHPLKLDPDVAYSPASIAKAYLDAMKITHPKNHFRVPNRSHGIAMQAYYGGRAECRIRKTPVPVVLTDFTSQYPTVNALLGNWSVLKSSAIRFRVCTAKVRILLSRISLENVFKPEFWKQLSFFALVQPDNDVLPVRTVYNKRTKNIGLNELSSKKPIWFAGPDLVASILLTGKAPRIKKAVCMLTSGQQRGLESTNLGGLVRIDPRKDDFFVRVVEQRNRFKRDNKSLSNFLKVLGNSGSYGLFIQIDPETRRKAQKVRVYSGEVMRTMDSEYIEKLGPWYFPPVASLITSGGRLLLAMLERCVQDNGGTYLFCDTDSMGIIASEKGGLVPCAGGKSRLNGLEAIKALSLEQVKSIAVRFNDLNPYNPTLVKHLLKIEDVNFVDSDSAKPHRQLYGYAIAAKRYALYTQTGNHFSIVKASGHGLGYLFMPSEKHSDNEEDLTEETEDVPAWVLEAWDWLLRKELKLRRKIPTWLSLPAMMRMTMSSPNVMRRNRPDWLSAFNFFLFPLLSDLGGYPAGFDRTNFRFIVPFESKRYEWKRLWGINLWGEQIYRVTMRLRKEMDTVVPDSFQIVLRQYLEHPEVKSLAPDGTPCAPNTAGLLRRVSVLAGDIVPIAKETDRHWEQGGDPSMLDFSIKELRRKKKMGVADVSDRKRWRDQGVRYCQRKSGLSPSTVSKILNGEEVKIGTLTTLTRAMGV
jgi:hypothetical protein